jgi:mono/diheme cytochrome c family protein
MKFALALVVAVVSACHANASTEASIRVGAQAEPWPLTRLRSVTAERLVRVRDPYENREVEFRAIPAVPVLDATLGTAWREAGDVEFECSDGYRASIPSARFLAHQAFFAFARTDRGEFRLVKPVGTQAVDTDLAPLYLVWSNLDDEVVRSEGDWGWPYQIVAIRAASASSRFSRIAPGAAASPGVQRGFGAFRKWCSSCHAINGVGGTVGPELNEPVSVTTYMAPGWLRRWISDPQSVRRDTEMPGLQKDVPDRERTIDDLIEYLTSVAPPAMKP